MGRVGSLFQVSSLRRFFSASSSSSVSTPTRPAGAVTNRRRETLSAHASSSAHAQRCRAPSLRSRGNSSGLPAPSPVDLAASTALPSLGAAFRLPLTAPSVFLSRTGSVCSSGDWLLEGFEERRLHVVIVTQPPDTGARCRGGRRETRSLTDGGKQDAGDAGSIGLSLGRLPKPGTFPVASARRLLPLGHVVCLAPVGAPAPTLTSGFPVQFPAGARSPRP